MRLLIILSIFFSLTSCTAVKKVFTKNKSEHKLEQHEEKKSEVSTTTDNTTTTTKQIDTVVSIPADSVKAVFSLPADTSDAEVDTLVSNSSGITVHAKYKPKSRQLSLEVKQAEKKVPVKATEQITSHTVINEHKKESSELDIKEKSKEKTVQSSKEVKRLPLWLAGLIIIALLWLVYKLVYGGWLSALVKRFKRKDPGNTG